MLLFGFRVPSKATTFESRWEVLETSVHAERGKKRRAPIRRYADRPPFPPSPGHLRQYADTPFPLPPYTGPNADTPILRSPPPLFAQTPIRRYAVSPPPPPAHPQYANAPIRRSPPPPGTLTRRYADTPIRRSPSPPTRRRYADTPSPPPPGPPPAR